MTQKKSDKDHFRTFAPEVSVTKAHRTVTKELRVLYHIQVAGQAMAKAQVEAMQMMEATIESIVTNQIDSEAVPPPKSAEYLLYLFLSHEDREALPGDLEEEYWTDILPKFGARRATLWYWYQALRSIWPFVSGMVGKLVWWLIKRFTS